jgi:hypothetical protein
MPPLTSSQTRARSPQGQNCASVARASLARASLARLPMALVTMALVSAALSGCASRAAPVRPAEDPAPIVRGVESEIPLDRPYRIVFRWSFQEPGARMSGQGVARVEPPFRARLDLFASNGERVATAALLDHELRIPSGMDGVPLPPPAMLWGALGIFRPGPGLFGLTAERTSADRAELRYRVGDGGDLRFRLRGNRVEFIERNTPDGGREELRLTLSAGAERFPSDALFRDLRAVRELRITLETVEAVESYPLDVWDPRD